MSDKQDSSETQSDAEKLANIISALQRCFIGKLEKDLAGGNISFSQYFLLGYLIQHGQLSMSEVAKKMEHTTAAATGIIDRLEKLRYVRRFRAEEDRRKVFVVITRQGIALVNRVREDVVSRVSGIMDHLTADEQKSWLHIYEKILNITNTNGCAS